MSKIINGVASEYEMPMKHENKTTTVFIDTQDMEERYGEELYKECLEKENKQLKEVIEEVREYINNYDVFKEFSFPLMKREEENQTKSSIQYEFDTSIKKELLQILDKVTKENK